MQQSGTRIPEASTSRAELQRLARVVAFYLPQFHPIPENDQWWGRGFTEWTNVRKAKPLFPGHNQPRKPGALGYYDLRNPATRAAQAELAKTHGVEAFCYWHYWFGNGKRLLELPFDQVVKSGEPKFSFCLCWANESWTGVWHGTPGRVLMEQSYPGKDDQVRHFEHILPAFEDERYFRVNGKPMFLVYRPDLLPDAAQFVELWQNLAVKAGLGGLFLVAMSNKLDASYLSPFDAVTHHGPGDYLNRFPFRKIVRRVFRRALSGRIADALPGPIERLIRRPARFDFRHVVETAFEQLPRDERFLPCVLSGWDNTPRSRHRGVVFENFSTELFRQFLRKAIDRVADHPEQTRLVFIKAWNEWAEGNYLEPDASMGAALLDVIRDEVLEKVRR